jgi:hypothetical protein
LEAHELSKTFIAGTKLSGMSCQMGARRFPVVAQNLCFAVGLITFRQRVLNQAGCENDGPASNMAF